MVGIAGIYVAQRDGTVLLKREYRAQEILLSIEQVRTLQQAALRSDHFAIFKLPDTIKPQSDPSERSYSVSFLRRNDLYFMALCRDDKMYGGESMVVYQVLKLFVEVVDEAFGLDKMRDNFSALTLLLDTMIDYGFPLITEKSILMAMLEKANMLNKAQDVLTGSASGKQSQTLAKALQQINNNPNALWRFNQNSKANENSESSKDATSFVKDCYVDLIEYADCIINENGEVEAQEISGEVIVEAKLPGAQPQVGIKLRLNQEVDDYAVHSQCQSKGLETIGNHEYSIMSFTPPFGRAVMCSYIAKPFSMSLPFHLKASYSLDKGVCRFDCRMERYSSGKDKEGSIIFPNIESVFVKFYFPDEINSASLTSHPEGGSFSFDEREKVGEWIFNSFADSQPGHQRLHGMLRVGDNTLNELSSQIVAIVNLKIKDYTYTGSTVEKVTCSLTGGSKDDPSVYKGFKRSCYAKNIEYRL